MEVNRTPEPSGRLTELSKVMTDALDAELNEGEVVRCVVMLGDDEEGGIQIHNYEDDASAIADMFVHLKAIFASRGQKMMVAPMPTGHG